MKKMILCVLTVAGISTQAMAAAYKSVAASCVSPTGTEVHFSVFSADQLGRVASEQSAGVLNVSPVVQGVGCNAVSVNLSADEFEMITRNRELTKTFEVACKNATIIVPMHIYINERSVDLTIQNKTEAVPCNYKGRFERIKDSLNIGS